MCNTNHQINIIGPHNRIQIFGLRLNLEYLSKLLMRNENSSIEFYINIIIIRQMNIGYHCQSIVSHKYNVSGYGWTLVFLSIVLKSECVMQLLIFKLKHVKQDNYAQ